MIDANQAGNANYNAATQVQQSITVNKGNQTISFTSTNPSPTTVGGATYTPTATATSGLAVAFTLDGTSTGCTLSGGVVTFTAVGTCMIDANQAGNANYNAAPQVQQSITVNKGNQTISFTSTNPSPTTVGGATYTPTATATSGLAVAFTLDGTSTGCTLSGGVVTFTAVGTCKIDANQAGNANYNAATQVQQSITVNKGNQTISFTSTNPSPTTVGGATYTPTATATSGLAVAFTLDGTSTGCTLSGWRRHLHRGRHLRRRRQPGRQRQLQRGDPGPAVDHRQQGQPDDLVHLGQPLADDGRRRHLHPDGHGHLGPGGGLHARRHEHRLHAERWRRHLHRGRHLRRRRQPGRQRQLQRGAPGPAVDHRQQGQPDDLVHLGQPLADAGRRRHLHPDGHGHLGPGGGLHPRRHEHRLHAERLASVTFTAVGTCVVDANQAGNANYNAAPQVQQIDHRQARPDHHRSPRRHRPALRSVAPPTPRRPRPPRAWRWPSRSTARAPAAR